MKIHRDIFSPGFQIVYTLDFFSVETKTVSSYFLQNIALNVCDRPPKRINMLLGSSKNAKLVANPIAKSPQSLDPLAWRW